MDIYSFFSIEPASEPDSKFWDFMVQMLASLLGVGGALYVYWLGNKQAKQKADDEKDRFEKDKLRYLFHLLVGAKKFTKKFIKGLEQLIKNIEADPTIMTGIPMSHYFDIDRFVNKINQEEHFHAYRNQRLGVSKITEIFNLVDFIESLRINTIHDLGEAILRDGQRRKDLTEIIEESRNLLVKYKNELVVDSVERVAIFNALDFYIKKYMEVVLTGDYKLIVNEYLLPLSTDLSIYSAFFPMATRAKSILNNLIRNNNLKKDELSADLVNLKEAYSDLKEKMRSIEDYIERINIPSNS